jgi:putative mRNA 3-end processing factor
VLGSAQVVVRWKGLTIVVSGDYKRRRDPTCPAFEPVPCDVFVTEATFGLPVFRHPDAADEVARLLKSVAQFPERAHLVGAYALGKAQRVIMLMREAGYDQTIWVHGAMEALNTLYRRHGVDLGPLALATEADSDLAGRIVICPPSAIGDRWSRRFADPVSAFCSGWMRVRARARQRAVELPLVISDHADWDELTDDPVRAQPRRGVDHPRPRGSPAALVRAARPAGAGPGPGGLRRRGRGLDVRTVWAPNEDERAGYDEQEEERLPQPQRG